MSTRAVLVLGLMGLFLGGCNLNNRSTAKATLRQLPNGDALVCSIPCVSGPFVHRTEEQQLVWERPGQPATVLSVTPASPSGDQEAYRTAEVHLSADGNRAWLTKGGKVLASFDRQTATAFLDEHSQPEWARP